MPFLTLQDDRFRTLTSEINDESYEVIRELLHASNPQDSTEARDSNVRTIAALIDGSVLDAGASQRFVDEIVAPALLIAE